MNFSKSVRPAGRPRVGVKQFDDSEEAKKYPYNVSFFTEPPGNDCSVSLQDFEDYAVTRLKLLRLIERVNLTSVIKYSKEWSAAITAELKKLDDLKSFVILGPSPPYMSVSEDEKNQEILAARKFDHYSHYIFRLAFCRTDELKKALIAMEIDFFHYKFEGISNTDLLSFLESKLHLKKIDEKTLASVKKDVENCNFINSKTTALALTYFEVDFVEVPDLVRGRKVFLKKGKAYVPYNEIISIVASKFRKELSHALSKTVQMMPMILEDERLSQILTDFDKRYTGHGYTKKDNGASVTAEMLPELSKKSFPLCMKSLYDVVEKENHLKHFGRLQLGLFFKAIGLPLEESISFWRNNFTKKAGVDGTRFDKQYLYNIRHMYGKEGKRADYTPYSCMKIIMGSVGPGEHHGCPFRHSDERSLRDRLTAAKVPSQGITEITDLVKNHHYQVACQKYFEWTHDRATVEGGIQHPNQYFEESQKASMGILSKPKVDVKRTKVSTYEKPSSFPDNSFSWDDKDDAAMIESMDQTLSEMDTNTAPETETQPTSNPVEASSS